MTRLRAMGRFGRLSGFFFIAVAAYPYCRLFLFLLSCANPNHEAESGLSKHYLSVNIVQTDIQSPRSQPQHTLLVM
ncbi:uncharacterized protein BDW70DRAFT_75029 [Aspergillus foveolatus]|uniref:uncharacterized protein n=1 Tax=Aspergillus foveolatus TaxID=210207 RepID=UPI003CCDFDF9